LKVSRAPRRVLFDLGDRVAGLLASRARAAFGLAARGPSLPLGMHTRQALSAYSGGFQEQSQMMTSANGTPTQIAPPIIDAKAESKFPS
jgi:hypothetical protein